MTKAKDFKRLVRARMARTGESYTAARAQLVRKSAAAPPRPKAAFPALAGMAGMADPTVRAKTGRSWAEWVRVLDGHHATGMKHRDIARLLSQQYGMPGWWTQTVTVGYERIKGLRARGQRLDGTYEAGKSRTFPVSVTRLFDAWDRPAARRRWLGDAGLTRASGARPRYIRFRHGDGTVVVIGFTAKGKAKSAVAVQHAKLPDKDASNRMKEYWSARLDALAEFLERRR